MKHYFIRDYIKRGDIELSYISIEEMVADIFIKLLP